MNICNESLALDEPALDEAVLDWPALIREARCTNSSVTTLLQAKGLPSIQAIQLLANKLGMPALLVQHTQEWQPVLTALSAEQARQWGILPLCNKSGGLCVAISNPFDPQLETRLGTLFQEVPERWLSDDALITQLLATQLSDISATDSTIYESAGHNNTAPPSTQEISISRRVNELLQEAMLAGASDIHLESTTNTLQLKLRIDGVLVAYGQLEGSALAAQIISRLKILSELDIAERRVPQDGRFQARLQSRLVDFRVSIMPSLNGEDAVVRILDRHTLTAGTTALTLDSIGFDNHTLQALRRMSLAPYGMLLVTGPTGSGKTTTLYAALSEVNNGEDKIITIEDPVEYQLPGILQIPVNEKKGLSFARGLRSILRHDPDKIMVGEIRDQETAEIAVQAALTGHLVLTTVHANNVFDVIGRFAHMGVDTHNFVSALTGIMAQRLVRLICPACSEPWQPSASELSDAGIDATQAQHYHFMRGRGCPQCRQSGYRGRQAIAEILPLNDELRDLIVNRASTRQLRQAAQQYGMHSLREAVLQLVQQGRTTLKEANRVTFVE